MLHNSGVKKYRRSLRAYQAYLVEIKSAQIEGTISTFIGYFAHSWGDSLGFILCNSMKDALSEYILLNSKRYKIMVKINTTSLGFILFNSMKDALSEYIDIQTKY